MFGAMLLSCLYNSSVSEKTTAGVIVCCVIGCISNGALMIVQKLFGVYAADQSLTVFNLFAFCLCALFSVLVLIVIKAYNKVHNVAQIPSDFSYRKSALPIVLLGGVDIYNQLDHDYACRYYRCGGVISRCYGSDTIAYSDSLIGDVQRKIKAFKHFIDSCNDRRRNFA